MMQEFPNTTFSYPPLHEILVRIEQGVALMGAKKYNQACLSLTQALQISKETLVSEMADSRCKDEARRSEESSSWLSCQLMSFVITRSNSMATLGDRFDESQIQDHHKSEIPDRSIYVYSTPLTVMACDQESELFQRTPSHVVQTILSLIIIFNMALANHLYALDLTRKGCSLAKSRSLLSRAYALYEHAKALQYQLELEYAWFFSLMIINNQAQVLAILGEHEGAEELLQGILSGLCCLNRHYREDNHEALPPIASLEGFSHNTSYLILKEVISAAAA